MYVCGHYTRFMSIMYGYNIIKNLKFRPGSELFKYHFLHFETDFLLLNISSLFVVFML